MNRVNWEAGMATGTNNPGQSDTVNRDVNKAESTAKKTIDQAANKANQAIDRTAQTAQQAPEAVSQAIDTASDRAKEAVDRASLGLKQTATTAATQVQQDHPDLVDQAYTVKANAAQSLLQAAQKIRSEGHSGEGQPVQQA